MTVGGLRVCVAVCDDDGDRELSAGERLLPGELLHASADRDELPVISGGNFWKFMQSGSWLRLGGLPTRVKPRCRLRLPYQWYWCQPFSMISEK